MSARNGTSRAERVRYASEHPEDPRHGTLQFARYYGCHCPDCQAQRSLEWHRAYLRRTSRHEPTPYTVAEHRAFKEPLCRDCAEFVLLFAG